MIELFETFASLSSQQLISVIVVFSLLMFIFVILSFLFDLSAKILLTIGLRLRKGSSKND